MTTIQRQSKLQRFPRPTGNQRGFVIFSGSVETGYRTGQSGLPHLTAPPPMLGTPALDVRSIGAEPQHIGGQTVEHRQRSVTHRVPTPVTSATNRRASAASPNTSVAEPWSMETEARHIACRTLVHRRRCVEVHSIGFTPHEMGK
jgi:hypothetical protein